VFRVHAQQRQYALASLNPRVKMDCPVLEPPAVELSDPFFGLAAGAAYTLEFAMYPFDSACADWFCFVNALRHGYETDTIVAGEHSGSLNTLENNPGWDIDGGAHAGNGMNWNGTGYTDPRCGPWGPKAWLSAIVVGGGAGSVSLPNAYCAQGGGPAVWETSRRTALGCFTCR
jgi:hypothetical protein